MITIEATADSLNRHAVLYNPVIQQQLRQGLEFEREFVPRACDNTYSSPNVTQEELIQQYQWKFTPKGGATFDSVENKLQPIKIDILLTGEDLEKWFDSWRVEWSEIGRDPFVWSLPRYLYENVYMPKILEEMNLNAWLGEFVPPTDGVAGVSINSVDGYKKKITDAIAGGKVSELPTGVFTPSTMVNQLESWVDSMPVLYRNKPGKIYMSDTLARWYWRDYRAKFGSGNGNMGNENNELRIERTNKVITPINAMEGSNRIIFNPSQTQNMIWGTRRGFPTMPAIRWEKYERSIKGMTEFYRFYGVEYWKHCFINDQE